MSSRSERALALLRELSGSPDAMSGDRLEDLGIDSLALAELAVAVERAFGVDLTGVRALDGSDTVGDVLAALDASLPAARAGLPFGTGWLQGFAGVVGGWALRWWVPTRVEGASNVPRSGPAVIAMNHERARRPADRHRVPAPDRVHGEEGALQEHVPVVVAAGTRRVPRGPGSIPGSIFSIWPLRRFKSPVTAPM